MQRYLSQLLTDLKAAHSKQPPPIDYRLLYPEYEHVPDEIAYVVEWENAPEQSLEALFGISPTAFPPEEKLTNSQMAQLTEAILELWAAWNIYAEMPDGAPPQLCYRVLTSFWRDEKICYTSEGMSILTLCNCHVPTCLWGAQFCECQYLEDDWAFGPSEDTPSGLPF